VKLTSQSQASSAKLQAPSSPALILPQLNDNRIIKEKDYENK